MLERTLVAVSAAVRGKQRKSGAEEETRTPTACSATAPSTLRVYQFHHLGAEVKGGRRRWTPKGNYRRAGARLSIGESAPNPPPNIVGSCLVCLEGRVWASARGETCHDRAVEGSGRRLRGIGSAPAPTIALFRRKRAWPGSATRLSRLQPMLHAGRLCRVGPGSQRQYPLPSPDQQLVCGVATGQTDDQPPGVTHHTPR